MCMSSSSSSSSAELIEQLNKSNAVLSTEKTAGATSEKTSTSHSF